MELLYIVLVAAISSVQSNLGADSMAPARRPLEKGYWPSDPRSTTRVDGQGHGLLIKPPYAANTNE